MAEKLKVFHLIKSLGRGGAEMLLPETLAVHDRTSFDFAYGYFLNYKNQVVPRLEELDAAVHCFKANRAASILLASARVARQLRQWKADLLHCHLPLAGISGRIAGRLADVPVVYTEHNIQERYHPLTRIANIRTMPWNRCILAVSGEVEQSLQKYIPGSSVPVRALLNGVNTNRFSPDKYDRQASRKKLGLPLSGPIVGTVAVFRSQKRLHLWIDLARELAGRFPDIHFTMVGDGPHFEDIREQAAAYGLRQRISFPGRLEEVRPWLAAMDLYLMTSEFEGLPVAMLEAMSMALPVVATAAGGIPEVIRHGREGYLAPVTATKELLPFITQLLTEVDQCRQMGTEARQRVIGSFSIERMARELEEIYRGVLRQQPLAEHSA